MNKTAFFDEYRRQFGSLSQAQVDGLEYILDRLDKDQPGSLEHAAYMLATTHHETAFTYEPIAEAYWVTPDAEAWREANLSYYPYYGRGYVQLTWLENYQKASDEFDVDLVTYPDNVMEREISYDVMLQGMMEGWFTGKKLDDYIKPGSCDYVNARKIINGTDKQSTIAGYAEQFESCLQSAGYFVPPKPQPLTCDMPTLKAPFANTIATNVLLYALDSSPADLENDVKAFQSANGLTADGIVGAGTWTAIYNAAQAGVTKPPADADAGHTHPPPRPFGERRERPQSRPAPTDDAPSPQTWIKRIVHR